MKCERCDKGSYNFALLPIGQADGRLDTIVCLECAEKSGAYCNTHKIPHLGFQDGTSACKECVEEVVVEDGERIAEVFTSRISSSKKRDEIQRDVKEWLELINLSLHSVQLADLSLALLVKQTPPALNISRAIITKAQRLKLTPEEVIEEVAREGAQVILPPLRT